MKPFARVGVAALATLGALIAGAGAARAGTINVSITGIPTVYEGQAGTFSSFHDWTEHANDNLRSISSYGLVSGPYHTFHEWRSDSNIYGDGTLTESYRFGRSGTYTYTSYADAYFRHWYIMSYGQYGPNWGSYETRATHIARTTFTVLNVAPRITSLTQGADLVAVGESFSFAASAYDPGADPLTFSWDFDGDGSFNDFTGRSGLHSFATAGLKTVSLRVADDDGGSVISQFNVDVFSPAAIEDASGVPLPGAASAAAALLLGIFAKRPRRQQA